MHGSFQCAEEKCQRLRLFLVIRIRIPVHRRKESSMNCWIEGHAPYVSTTTNMTINNGTSAVPAVSA